MGGCQEGGEIVSGRGIIFAMRCEARFTGRVQGVGFRMVTHEIARQHGVHGWVRNEADGTVLAVIEGPSAAVDSCLDEIRERMCPCITDVSVCRCDEDHGYDGFEIRG